MTYRKLGVLHFPFLLQLRRASCRGTYSTPMRIPEHNILPRVDAQTPNRQRHVLTPVYSDPHNPRKVTRRSTVLPPFQHPLPLSLTYTPRGTLNIVNVSSAASDTCTPKNSRLRPRPPRIAQPFNPDLLIPSTILHRPNTQGEWRAQVLVKQGNKLADNLLKQSTPESFQFVLLHCVQQRKKKSFPEPTAFIRDG